MNIIVIGTGGQGILTLVYNLTKYLTSKNQNIKTTLEHTLAKRGGYVAGHIKTGRAIYSPFVSHGDADLVLSLEPLETLRFAKYFSNKTNIIVVNKPEYQPTNYLYKQSYPSFKKIESDLKKITKNVTILEPKGWINDQILNYIRQKNLV